LLSINCFMDSEGLPAPGENIANSIKAVKIILFIYNKYDFHHTTFQK